MRLASFPFLLGVAACGFNGSEGMPDGPMNDGPPLMPGEVDLAVNTVELWNVGAMNGTFVSTAGSASGSVEPIARVAGKLFLEMDDDQGPYDGTWASHPQPSQLVRTSLLAPPFANFVPGGPQAFVYWMTGEIKLEAGAQKIAIQTSPGALAFVDVLSANAKAELVHCSAAMADCSFTTAAAGWYPIRIGWKRTGGQGANLQLRGALGGGELDDIDAATRLRAPLTTPQHRGSKTEAAGIPRGFMAVEAAVMLDVDLPIDLRWGGSTFGLNGPSTSYRNSTQLRITEDATYDFAIDADPGISYRLWIDGEWVSAAAAYDYITDNTDPPLTTISRALKAGWHDVVIDGYDTRGNNGAVKSTYGKQGKGRAPAELDKVRPAVGTAPLMSSETNTDPIQLASNATVSRTVDIAALATAAPDALAVDVSVALKPRAWNGLQILVVPPGSTTGIPLTYDRSMLRDNQSATVTGSLAKAALPAGTKAQGPWRVDVIHAANAQLDASNVISEVEVHAHYAGGAGTAAAPFVSPSSTYTRMFKLAAEQELRNLYAETIKPAGSDIKLEIQTCTDEEGTSCAAAMSIEQLIERKPMARFAKVTATFTSDGFAVPILGKLILRYLDASKVE
jgi:hypothetical protein